MANYIDGKAIALEIKTELYERITRFPRHSPPKIAVILLGQNPASSSYVTAKERDCSEIGIHSIDIRLSDSTTEKELLQHITMLNNDASVDGILVQLPLPEQINPHAILLHIDPAKDVDGFHPVSLGKMILGIPTLLPCTPYGIVQLLLRSQNDPAGKHVVIVGRSNIVGRPLANLLSQKSRGGNATVTLSHSASESLGDITRSADILVAAVGKAGFIVPDMVKNGAVVIDVGVNWIPDTSKKRGYRLCGDAAESVAEKAAAITPVPGGIGPMTRVMLLHNTVTAAERRRL